VQSCRESRIDFDDAHLSSRFDKSQGERSQPWSYFENVIALSHTSYRDNASNGVGVMNKVLPKLFRRGDTEFLGEATNLGGTQ
jgi:hypothetical protein